MSARGLATLALGSWGFAIAFLLACLFALFNGLLMLFSPARQARFWDRVVRADRWSQPSRDWKPGRELEKRFAGLAMAIMALWMISLPARWLLHPRPKAPPAAVPRPTPQATPRWSLLIVAVPAFAWGLYMLTKPDRVIYRTLAQRSQRIYPNATSRAGLWVVRLIGFGMMVVSAFGILWSVTGFG